MDKPGYIVYLLRHCKCCSKHTGLLHWNDYTIYDIFLLLIHNMYGRSLIAIFFPTVIVNTCLHDCNRIWCQTLHSAQIYSSSECLMKFCLKLQFHTT